NLLFLQVAREPLHYFKNPQYEIDVSQQLRNALLKIRRTEIEPDLIVTYGDFIAHSAARIDDPMVKEVPMLCLGVMHPQWKDLLAGMSNVVVMESEPAVKENLDFIKAMGLPDYVVTVMDSTYLDDHIRANMRRQMGNDTCHYRLNARLDKECGIPSPERRDSLITLFPVSTMWAEYPGHQSGLADSIDLSSVFSTRKQKTSYLHLKDDPYSNAAMNFNVGHFFAMTPEYFNVPLISALNSCLGGYMTPFPSMFKQVHSTVDRLISGADPRSIPWGRLKKDYWLDWRLARNIHPYGSDFPKGTHFVNITWVERSRLNFWILNAFIGILLIFFILYAIVIPVIMLVRQKRQRRMLVEKAEEAGKAEERVRDILSDLDVYLWRAFPDMTLKFSDSFYRDFGFPEGNLDLETVLTFVQEPGRSQIRNLILEENFEGDKDVQGLLELPDNPVPRPILVHSISLSKNTFGGDGQMVQKAGILHFNDKAYHRNEELREAYRRSEEFAEKENFLSSMSSDFQAPMDKIAVYSQFLVQNFREISDEQKDAAAQMVIEGNMHMVRLLDDVMGVTKQGRKIERHISACKLSEMMEQIYINTSIAAPDNLKYNYKGGPEALKIMVCRPDFIRLMGSILFTVFLSAKDEVSIGWRHEPDRKDSEAVIFIENGKADIALYGPPVEKLGGKIQLLEKNDGSCCLELSFREISYEF
ncbi:MAG: hypothetical protein ACI4UJ_00585, partial [Candidatus Cryptobacteroides sp.]